MYDYSSKLAAACGYFKLSCFAVSQFGRCCTQRGHNSITHARQKVKQGLHCPADGQSTSAHANLPATDANPQVHCMSASQAMFPGEPKLSPCSLQQKQCKRHDKQSTIHINCNTQNAEVKTDRVITVSVTTNTMQKSRQTEWYPCQLQLCRSQGS